MTLTTLALILAAGCGALATSAYRAHAAARYHTETVERAQVTGVLRLPARVLSTTEIRVGSLQPAQVHSVEVRPGQRVERGQVLARLDTRRLRAAEIGAEASALAAQVGARQAQVRMAEVAYLMHHASDQDPRLASLAMEAEIALVNATAEMKKQTAAWVIARAGLDGATLRSPIAGVVAERAVEAGETVAAGVPLFVIASDPSELQLQAGVSEVDAARLRPGKVTFEVPAHPGRRFEAETDGVIERAPVGSGLPYRLRLRASNGDGALAAGMSAQLVLPAMSASAALTVPARAVSWSPRSAAGEREPAVYLLEGDRPRRVVLTPGVSDGQRIEVRTSALSEGARVIVAER
jgi:HlyD family secretion protein